MRVQQAAPRHNAAETEPDDAPAQKRRRSEAVEALTEDVFAADDF